MFDQLLGGVQCHPSEIIGREEEEGVVQARKSLPLLVSRCKMSTNVSPQEPLVEWMRTIDVLLWYSNYFLPRQSAFSPFECDLVAGLSPEERCCVDGVNGAGM